MLDLDNTLVDRDAAFRDAVTTLLAEHRLPGTDLTCLGYDRPVPGHGARHGHPREKAFIESYRDGSFPYVLIAADRV